MLRIKARVIGRGFLVEDGDKAWAPLHIAPTLTGALAAFAPSAILPGDWPTASWAGIIDPQDESRSFWNE